MTKNVLFEIISGLGTLTTPAPPWETWVPDIDTNLLDLTAGRDFPEQTRVVSQDYISDNYEENGYTTIYTDGSKTSTGAAYSVCVPALFLSITNKCDVSHSA